MAMSQTQPAAPVSRPAPTLARVRCPECGKYFHGRAPLSSHLRSAHPQVYAAWKAQQDALRGKPARTATGASTAPRGRGRPSGSKSKSRRAATATAAAPNRAATTTPTGSSPIVSRGTLRQAQARLSNIDKQLAQQSGLQIERDALQKMIQEWTPLIERIEANNQQARTLAAGQTGA